MCGIAGFNWPDPKLIKQMTDSLAHRGPDGEGQFVDNKVSLGHRRLSILDLTEKGSQPMKYKNFLLVFNGEIFNFQTIRTELTKKGHRFRSQSDTEVIIHSYEEWGTQCVNKFNGQWAFVIYDTKKQTLFLSRDRFGIKPLFYAQQAGQFLFASEIKAILKHKLFLSYNKQALNQYFFQKYIQTAASIYQQINQLKPGHNAIYDLNKTKLTVRKYYSLSAEIKKQKKQAIQEKLARITELIRGATEDRLVADVPVGTFLSGGLDSSLVTALAREKHSDLNTFSVGFSESSYDESPYAQDVARHLGTKHQAFEMKVDDDLFEKVLAQLDQPFGDSSILPTYLLAKHTRAKVTVALSGDGADEVFGGYDTYRAYALAEQLPSVVFHLLKPITDLLPISHSKVNKLFLLKRFIQRHQSDPQSRHLDYMSTYPFDQRLQLMMQACLKVEDKYPRNTYSETTQLQMLDFETYLPGDILVKTDRASMMNGLEVRVPYLDYQLVPLVLSLPQKYKLDVVRSKKLLKTIARDYLPDEIVNRTKRGFTVPLASWLNSSKFLQELLLSSSYYQHMIIDKKYVKLLWQQQSTMKRDTSRELWLVAVFNYWWWKRGKQGSL